MSDVVRNLILILMGGVLVNNYVLQQFLGICPFLGVSKKVNQATGMGIAVTFVNIRYALRNRGDLPDLHLCS